MAALFPQCPLHADRPVSLAFQSGHADVVRPAVHSLLRMDRFNGGICQSVGYRTARSQ